MKNRNTPNMSGMFYDSKERKVKVVRKSKKHKNGFRQK